MISSLHVTKVIMLIMIILTQTIIPRFFGLMAATLAGDAIALAQNLR